MAPTAQLCQITDAELVHFADLIYQKTGIRLSPRKKNLISNRLRRRLRANNLDGFDAYFKLLNRLPSDSPEWEAFLQEITTHETYMFRDPTHWKWLRDVYLPERAQEQRRNSQANKLRIWSAACSTGEEVYSIALTIADVLNIPSWNISILGTDIGVGALDAAKKATYGDRAIRHVPESYRRRFLTQSPDGKTWTVKPQVTQLTNFRHHNLLAPIQGGPFDLVFVKNVLIYFDGDSKAVVMNRVMNSIRPGGLILNGPAEGVSGLLQSWERIQPWLYRKPGA